jgi:very-short-patch-repair endonuclease
MTSTQPSSLFELLQNARRMRKAPTPAERIFWHAVRDRRFRGLKFRRQHVLTPFIVDFFVDAAKLAIELDGGYHERRVAEDQARDAWILAVHGVRVVRVTNEAVVADVYGVLRAVFAP